MVPTAAGPKLVLGAVRGGVLVALNASTRNSARTCSLMGNILASMTSRVWYPGPITGLRELLPSVNWGAWVNAAVLNQRAVLRSSEGSTVSPVRFGLWMPNPANALRLVAWVTTTGLPDCSRTIPASCQPPASAFFQPFKVQRRPWPRGSSQTKDPANTCGILPVE